MRIAFTHNLRTLPTEEQAEFDSPETVDTLAAALAVLGHEVVRIDVTAPLPEVVDRLRDARADLCFNTAEGVRGPHREALYPAIFEELGLPYTGSDPRACALTLDKQLTKLVVAEAGVPVARGLSVRALEQLPASFPLPAFVKPNFEGSSKGITARSRCTTRAELEERVAEQLAQYPDGVLVEEYVDGVDVVVPFLEGTAPEFDGVLTPSSYLIGGEVGAIYDYRSKNDDSDSVEVVTPAALPAETLVNLRRVAHLAFRALGIRDLGRLDFRVRPDGGVVFIEANALPSLEPGASIYAASAREGLEGVDAVLGQIIESAARRFRIETKRARVARRKPKVGLVFNLKRDQQAEEEAEFDSMATVEALRDAIASHGHEVALLEADPELAGKLDHANFDVAFNIAEGYRGRGRESLVPSLLELHEIPYTGSDPATLALALDKGLAKRVVHSAGIATPRFFLARTGREAIPRGMDFPLIAKPVAEGSSKGVTGKSVVRDREELREVVMALRAKSDLPVLVEEFLTGREFTVGVLGKARPRTLPLLEVVFTGDEAHPVYGYEQKQDSRGVRFECPAKVAPEIARAVESVAKRAFVALGCRDVARIDVRFDGEGNAHFIECNPLPGLSPGWSDLCVIAEAAGWRYEELVGAILRPALVRWRDRNRMQAAVASS